MNLRRHIKAVTKSAAISSEKIHRIKRLISQQELEQRIEWTAAIIFFFLQVLEKSNSYSCCCCSSSLCEKSNKSLHVLALCLRRVKELISAAVGFNAPNSFEATKYRGTMLNVCSFLIAEQEMSKYFCRYSPL